MTLESSARGRPHVQGAVDPGPTAEIHDVLERMHDSAVGLRKAAGLVSDDSLTRYLAGVERRLRRIAGEIGSDIIGLSEWRHAEEGDR